jgi:hypothetical protein
MVAECVRWVAPSTWSYQYVRLHHCRKQQQRADRDVAAGDRGFDPLGLAKPAEYLQVDVDELDQNKAVNKPGEIIGSYAARKDMVSNTDALQPYDEVRFRSSRSDIPPGHIGSPAPLKQDGGRLRDP